MLTIRQQLLTAKFVLVALTHEAVVCPRVAGSCHNVQVWHSRYEANTATESCTPRSTAAAHCCMHVLAAHQACDNRAQTCSGLCRLQPAANAEVQAAEAELQHLQQNLMTQQAELGAVRARVQVCLLFQPSSINLFCAFLARGLMLLVAPMSVSQKRASGSGGTCFAGAYMQRNKQICLLCFLYIPSVGHCLCSLACIDHDQTALVVVSEACIDAGDAPL